MLYVIRHGRTDWNVLYKLQGQIDIPLNDEGRQMARDAAREYADINFDICFCSPLVRAKETAEILLEGRNVPIFFDERLKEMSFGNYEGSQRVYEQPDHPIRPLFMEPENYKAPETAESLEHLMARTGEFLEEKAYPLVKEGKDVLIVGHGAMNSSIICQFYKRSLKDFWKEDIKNCKLKTLI